MWRPRINLTFRMRTSTIILLTVIVTMGFAMCVQERREERLRSALRLARDENNEAIHLFLAQPRAMPSATATNLKEFLLSLSRNYREHLGTDDDAWSAGARLWFYVDPVGLEQAGKTILTPVTVPTTHQLLGKTVEEVLTPLGLAYRVRDGRLVITSKESLDRPFDNDSIP